MAEGRAVALPGAPLTSFGAESTQRFPSATKA